MRLLKERMSTAPVPVIRQSRPIEVRGATTFKPGFCVPVAAFNLLREDSVQLNLPFAVDMRETHELLINKTFLKVTSVFVPHLAHPRFEKNATFFQKSYQGVEPFEDGDVIPFITTHAYGTAGANAVYKALGLLAPAATQVNTAYLEAYNLAWNFIAMLRSKGIEARDVMDGTLAPAFWSQNNMSEIVPDFDDALIAGEVPLTVQAGRMPVGTDAATSGGVAVSVKASAAGGAQKFLTASDAYVGVSGSGPVGAAAQLYAEMQANSIVVSLANLEQAKKLTSWARLREQYEGHTDEWIIDTLMQGFRIEEQEFTQPIILDTVTVPFQQGLRYSTDHDNMDVKATNGVATGSIRCHVPPNTYGGTVIVLAEVVPEQLYERQPDPWFTATAVEQLPNYFKDVMNPMPVEKVLNGQVDAMHSSPTGLFGYARKNWRWLRWPMRIGGDMFGGVTGTVTTEARKRIWPTDVANPKLAEEFYLSTTLDTTPFIDQTRDQFMFAFNGVANITGLTVIGAVHESEANYEAVRDAIPELQSPKV